MSTSNIRKRFTILHSNDIHGDFMEEVVKGAPGHMVGGLSLLSGYINKVRKEEKNVLYLIAGDMVQGSMIDTEFKGVSTMELMNYLAPDAATIGNHELDYGLYHLLFLEKMANFPIVVSNLYIKQFHKRLMKPYLKIHIDGFDILIIGIITDEIMSSLKLDKSIGSHISLQAASEEVGRICNAYKDEDIDLTILLTHIGFEEDKKLAAMLDPAWGVDMMIGGHSHTILEQPEVINNILITQAGVGTDQIGRFDILVDDDTNSIVEWKWELLQVNEDLAEPDPKLQEFIESFQEVVDRKYNTIICKFAKELTHPDRSLETELGNLFADILAQNAQVDVAFLNSGAIRGEKLGPLVTLGDFKSIFPYNSPLHKLAVSGALLKQIFSNTLHPEERIKQRTILQINKGVKAVYNDSKFELDLLTINGEAVEDDKQYSIALLDYYFQNTEAQLGIKQEALTALAGAKVVTTAMVDVVEEYLRNNQNLNSRVEGRVVF